MLFPRPVVIRPLLKHLYEAALYFRGAEPHEGDRDEPHTSWNDSSSQLSRRSLDFCRSYVLILEVAITQVGAPIIVGKHHILLGAPYGECNTPFRRELCIFVPSTS